MDIVFKKVDLIYQPNTPFASAALEQIDLRLESGKFYAVVGQTGSGKSTLIQLINGLLLPTAGEVRVADFRLSRTHMPSDIQALRRKIGMVFQFPESQLFEETVEKEICFGPLNFGCSESEAKRRAKQALEWVGLPLSFLDRSPFSLSGGEMRRLAIASIWAAAPDVLILDEPTAGLDGAAQAELMAVFSQMQKESGCTVILITHQMDDAAQYADEIVVMRAGRVLKHGSCAEIFSNAQLLAEAGLALPTAVRLQKLFERKFGLRLPVCCYTLERLAEQIQAVWRGEAE